MKKIIGVLSLVFASQLANSQVNSKLAAYADEITYSSQNQPNFIKFKESQRLKETEVSDFINTLILNNSKNKVAVLKSERDELGFTHVKYNILQNGILVFNKMIIAHSKDGKLVSLNGDLVEIKAPSNNFLISEKSALNYALKTVKAKKYKWQNKEEEQHMREVLNEPNFTYYPKGTKVMFEKDGNYYDAFQFNIYAEEPLYRANVFVDASTGKVLAEQNLICKADVSGTANTKYSGTQTITCDQNGTTYRLKEVQRGLGIETYNLHNSMSYANNNFTNTSTSWTTTGFDQGATDAHWGAEMTYDFYMTKFNRNSVDNAGKKLLSYVHYGNNFQNAFWNGQCMTYGDGGGSFGIYTALDVCGHEITHGVVSNTGGLNGGGAGEADALNEGFADIFGTSIERFARPTNYNWVMALDITPGGFRNMQNPKSLQNPDTYLGQYWDSQGEPHNNAGPATKWFYLLINGGTGTNDIGSVYNVSGLGNVSAEKIAYRAMVTYFIPSTNYTSCRAAAIQAAKDIFGNCSNEVIQTANAWYAVGVGPQYTQGVVGTSFTANNISFCSLPASVNFNNATVNGNSYLWDFGDGTTSTSFNTAHTFTSSGTFNVKLKGFSCTYSDSMIKTIYVNVPTTPVVSGISSCQNAPAILNATGNSNIKWYTNPNSNVVGTGNSFTTPNLTANTTYYVANTIANPSILGGRLNNTNGGYLNNSAQWLVFDVLQNSILKSVVVYASTAGNRTIEWRDASATVLALTTVSLSVGANTVTLNYNLYPGTGYQLGLTAGSTAALYRSNSGSNYPYNIGGCVNITASNAGTTYYYWFYNWQVAMEDCSSPLVPVTVTMIPAPAVSITTPSAVVCSDDIISLSGNPSGGVFSGAGVSGSSFNASTLGGGNYSVIYSVTGGNGCVGKDSIAMKADACTGIKSLQNGDAGISIYPNPVKENLIIKSDVVNTDTKIILTDATGRLIVSKNISSAEEKIDLTDFSKGLYILTIRDRSEKTIKITKLVKE